MLLFVGIVLITSSIVLLFYFNNQNVVTTEETVREFQNSNQILSNPMSAFSQLNEEEQEAYLRITNEIDNLNSSFSLLGNNVNESQLNKIVNAILVDHPEFFYIENIEFLKNKNDIVETVTVNFTADKETIQLQQEEVENWKNNILAAITPDMSNYDIALFLHDHIVNNTEYNLEVENNQNLLSVVEEGESVCAGYSKAYQYLLNEAGIFATYVSGSVNVGAHAWNLIQVDGDYGWVDVTWDDPSFSQSDTPLGITSHTYFGQSTDDLLVTHKIDEEFAYIDNIDTPNFNYFIRNNLYFDLNDPNGYYSFIEAFNNKKNNGEGSIEVKLAQKEQINTLLNNLTYEPFLFNNTLNYIQDQYYPIVTFLLN